MGMSAARHASVGLVVVVALGSGCDSLAPECDPANLAAELRAATPGSTVTMGACRVEGSFRVPAGVTFAGQGPASVVAPTLGSAIYLEPGVTPARVSNLAIEGTHVAGIASAPDGACGMPRAGGVVIERVSLSVRRGWGIYLSCLESAQISDSVVHGPVTEANHGAVALGRVRPIPVDVTVTCRDPIPSSECTPGTTRPVSPADCPGCGVTEQTCDECGQWASVTASHALHLVDVRATNVENVTVSGFGLMTVAAVRSGMTWTTGSIADQLGVGLVSFSSTVDLANVQVRTAWRNPMSDFDAIGVYATDSDVTSTDLSVRGSDGYGMVTSGGTSSLTNLTVAGNANAGLWASRSTSFQLSGSHFADNALGGVVVMDSSGVSIRDTTVTGTRFRLRGGGGVEATLGAGDGVLLRGTYTDVVLERVTLENNERIGLLVDLGAMPDITFRDVSVSGSGTQLGAIGGTLTSALQLAPILPGSGWDTGITRRGVTGTNDVSATGAVDVYGTADPTNIVPPDEAGGISVPTD